MAALADHSVVPVGNSLFILGGQFVNNQARLASGETTRVDHFKGRLIDLIGCKLQGLTGFEANFELPITPPLPCRRLAMRSGSLTAFCPRTPAAPQCPCPAQGWALPLWAGRSTL